MGAEYKVHTKLLTEFETLGVMGENCSGIIKMDMHLKRGIHVFIIYDKCTMSNISYNSETDDVI